MRDERGMTLVEVVIATFILTVIAVAIGETIIVSFTQRLRTDEQLSGSLDRQRLSSAFLPDVASADVVERGQSSCAGGGAGLVTLSWTDRGISKAVTYTLEGVGAGRRLVRRYCENGELKKDEQVIADSVAEGTDAARVICDPDSPLAPERECARSVTLSVTDGGIVHPGLSDEEVQRRTAYSVTGKRRVQG